jgi:hypothetical protein
LEKINTIGDELLLINGFLTLPPEKQRVPSEKIQKLLAAYEAGDGESCRKAIEQNLQFHIGKIQRRIVKNDGVLTSARDARRKPLAPPLRPLKHTPEQRLAELESMIEKVESLQQRLGHIASQYTQGPMEEESVVPEGGEERKSSHKRDRGGMTLPQGLGSQQHIERQMEIQESAEDPIERQVKAVHRELSMAEEITKELLSHKEIAPEGQPRFFRRLQAALRSNFYIGLQARALIEKIDATSEVAQEIQKKMASLEASIDPLRSIIARLSPMEVSSEKKVREPPRFEDFASLTRRAEEESRREQRQEAVHLQGEIYKNVVIPAERQLREEQNTAQERMHERSIQAQSQESRMTRRFMAASGVIGTAGVFLAQDAVNVAAVAVAQPTVLEGVAAGVGALTQLHPLTQAVAIGALAMTEVPSWDWTQRCTGVAVGGVTSFFIGPIGGFAVGTMAGKYGPEAVRRARAAVSGIASPALRRLVQNRLLQHMARRSDEEERAPQLP